MHDVVPRSLARPGDAHAYVVSMEPVRDFIGPLTLLTPFDRTSLETLPEWEINLCVKSS